MSVLPPPPLQAAPCPAPTLPASAPADPPRTLAALVAEADAVGMVLQTLAADAETLGLVLPIFGRVAATTTGPHALLSERGGYGPVRLAGQRGLMLRKRICLRLTSGRGEHLVMTPADPARRRPAALHLLTATGLLCHRTEVSAPEDLLLLTGLCAQLAGGSLNALTVPQDDPDTRPAPCPASIPLIRRAQSEWQGMDETAHLDEILLDGGPARANCLRHLGQGLARPIQPARILPFLSHLAGLRIPFRRIVTRPGCLQSHSGATELVSAAGNDLVLLRSKASLFALDCSAIASGWLTRWDLDGGAQNVVELYGQDGQCLALLTGRWKPAKEADLWNRLTAMLAET